MNIMRFLITHALLAALLLTVPQTSAQESKGKYLVFEGGSCADWPTHALQWVFRFL
jgi:hypothetical protein